MRISVTSTRSKVKVKVTGLLKFRQLHFCRSITYPPPFWRGALRGFLSYLMYHRGGAEIAGVDIAGVDNDGRYCTGGHCRSGQ